MSVNFNDIAKQGYVKMKSKNVGVVWKKKWLVLKIASSRGPCCLTKYDEERNAKFGHSGKVIDLTEASNIMQTSFMKKNSITITFPNVTEIFACDSETEAESWFSVLSEHVSPAGVKTLGRTASLPPSFSNDFNQDETYFVSMLPSVNTDVCGECLLQVKPDRIQLLGRQPPHQYLLHWPLNSLRRYGKDKSKFTFEAGRHCDTGEGIFTFSTTQGYKIYDRVHSATNIIAETNRVFNRQQFVQARSQSCSNGTTEVNNNKSPAHPKLKTTSLPARKEPPPLPPRPPDWETSVENGDSSASSISTASNPSMNISGVSRQSSPDDEVIYEERNLDKKFVEYLKKKKVPTATLR